MLSILLIPPLCPLPLHLILILCYHPLPLILPHLHLLPYLHYLLSLLLPQIHPYPFLHQILYLIYLLFNPYLPQYLQITILCRPDPSVVLLNLIQNWVTRLCWTIPSVNLPLIRLLLNILSGVRPWMLSFKHYKGSRHGFWFLHLQMLIWLGVNRSTS